MSFTVTITGIPDKELGPLLARLQLPRAATYETKHSPDHVALLPNPKKPRANGATILTMTGKKPRSSVPLSNALTMFEKLEAKHKIGSVSVDMFKADLKKRRQKPMILTRLVNEGYLSYL